MGKTVDIVRAFVKVHSRILTISPARMETRGVAVFSI